MESFGMRKPSVGHPEALTVAGGIDDKGVLIPTAGRCSIVCENGFGSGNRRSAIRVNHSPVPIAAAEQDQDSAKLALFDELKSVRHLKLTGATLWKTAFERIVLQEIPLAAQIQRFRPGLKGRNSVCIRYICQQAIVVHRDFRTLILHEYPGAGCPPISLLSG